jgi:ABC-type multidrug transport system permease subunit
MLGAFIVSLGSTAIVLVVLIVALGVVPANLPEALGVTLLVLVIFIAVGTLLGALFRQRQPVLALGIGTSIPLFFLSGAFGPISFSTPAIQVLAKIFPVYYGIVLEQHAFHGFTLNTYGLTVNVLILGGYAAALIVLAALVLRRSTVTH